MLFSFELSLESPFNVYHSTKSKAIQAFIIKHPKTFQPLPITQFQSHIHIFMYFIAALHFPIVNLN